MDSDKAFSFSVLRYGNKISLMFTVIIITTLVFDTSIIKTYDLISKKETSSWRISIFVIIVIICIVGQYFLLEFVRNKRIKGILTIKGIRLTTVHKLIVGMQLVLSALLVIVLLEIVMASYYSTLVLSAITSISYALAIAMMVLLAQRFFSWYTLNRNSIILLYGLSAVILAINAGFTFFLANDRFINTLPAEILPRTMGSGLTLLPSWAKVVNQGYFVTSILSFLITWASTSLLLQHYSQKLGKIKYWIILTFPLAYFLSQFITFVLNTFEPLIEADPVSINIFVTLLFTLSKPIGGILFGIAFWIMAKSVGRDNVVRDYLIISAYGFVLLFTSNQAIVLLTAPYPPFGLPTISFVGLSSYLILVGIYSSAMSVSLDVGLRKSIRKSVEEHSKFLHGIGRAQLDQGIRDVVMKVTKDYSDKMIQKTGVEPSLTDSDIKQYLEEVLTEVRKGKDQANEK